MYQQFQKRFPNKLRTKQLIIREKQLIAQPSETRNVFKNRERKIKNTSFYPGLPFLKGYVQSFAN